MEKDELDSWQGTPSEVSHVCQRKGLSFKISFQTELNPLFTSLTYYYVQFSRTETRVSAETHQSFVSDNTADTFRTAQNAFHNILKKYLNGKMLLCSRPDINWTVYIFWM